MPSPVRVALVGAGQFGRHHARVISQSPRARLALIVDTDPARASELAAQHGCETASDIGALRGKVDAAVIAAPTSMHAGLGCAAMESGIDVLVEKPIAADLASAQRLVQTAHATGRILQAGHLERFNPAVAALEQRVRLPLFFEIHRMSVFSPRSLDVDVVLDLMIHDLDLVLNLAGDEIEEIRAAGISILTPKVDIANVRLQFRGGCVANLTASRVSTDRVRKLRLFQPGQYLSLDYSRQDLAIFSVDPSQRISFEQVPVTQAEPLQLQFEAFLDCVETRAQPRASGEAAARTLEAALSILDKIEEHARVVSRALQSEWKRQFIPG